MRINIERDPFVQPGTYTDAPWFDNSNWPAKWIRLKEYESIQRPFVACYCLEFEVAEDFKTNFHVTADERYELYIDGELFGSGSERGDLNHWFFETYEHEFKKGNHTIAARVWSLGEEYATGEQLTKEHGFVFAVEGEYSDLLSTGSAKWMGGLLPGITFKKPKWFFDVNTGVHNIYDLEKYPKQISLSNGCEWSETVAYKDIRSLEGSGHLAAHPFLTPATLPPMMRDKKTIGTVKLVNEISGEPLVAKADGNISELCESVQDLLSADKAMVLKENQKVWALVDLDDYYCVYPQIALYGEGKVEIEFTESLNELDKDGKPAEKKNRGAYDGKAVVESLGDSYIAGKELSIISPLWFRTGRWMIIKMESGDTPLTIENLNLYETRYPLECSSSFSSDSEQIDKIKPLALRSLQMCAHETYFDCPYYEQMMYIGDTRLQSLITYSICNDARLPHKSIKMFDWSRNHTGLTTSCYPVANRQTIPTFSLIWISMIYDAAMWTESAKLVKESLNGMRAIINYWEGCRNDDNGLIISPPGWNFVDWVKPDGLEGGKDYPRWGEVNGEIKWDIGTPPGGYCGETSGIINILYVYILKYAIDLELIYGDAELAQRYKRLQNSTLEAVKEHLYDEEKGLIADNLDHTLFSEHSQVMAILSGACDDEFKNRLATSLFDSGTLMAKTTYYFSHYYFETCRVTGRMDKLFERQNRWQGFLDLDLKTTLEEPEPSRSDCHAWAAHPLFHWLTTILGIRPSSTGFKTVDITPQLGNLEHAEGKMTHPLGDIEVECCKKEGELSGKVRLPEGLSGTLNVNGKIITLNKPVWYEF